MKCVHVKIFDFLGLLPDWIAINYLEKLLLIADNITGVENNETKICFLCSPSWLDLLLRQSRIDINFPLRLLLTKVERGCTLLHCQMYFWYADMRFQYMAYYISNLTGDKIQKNE